MKKFLYLFILLNFSACVTTPTAEDENVDPWENMNRSIFNFNLIVDNNILEPIANGYDYITPKFIQNRLGDFFNNLDDIGNLFNSLLQGKLLEGFGTLGRIVLNSTVGWFGFFDVASGTIDRKPEDFGQTLATWGVGSGPYLVLPFLGPSTLRDGMANIIDYSDELNLQNQLPTYELYGATAIKLLNTRVKIDSIIKVMKNRKDPYDFAKFGFLENRKNNIYDGKLPKSSQKKKSGNDDFDDF
jgi:phospholipid-binding lipoprotein MlaA